MPQSDRPTLTILRRRQLEVRIGLSRSGIYNRLNPKSPHYDATFPRPVRLGVRSVGWIEAEIHAWIEACAAARGRAA